MQFNDRRSEQAHPAKSPHVKQEHATPKKVGRKGHVPQVADAPKPITRKRRKRLKGEP